MADDDTLKAILEALKTKDKEGFDEGKVARLIKEYQARENSENQLKEYQKLGTPKEIEDKISAGKLSDDDKKLLEGVKALGLSLADIKKRVEEFPKLEEANKTNERNALLDRVAKAANVKLPLLKRDQELSLLDYTFKETEVEVNGEKKKLEKVFVKVKDGETTKEVEFSEYMNSDADRKEVFAAMTAEANQQETNEETSNDGTLNWLPQRSSGSGNQETNKKDALDSFYSTKKIALPNFNNKQKVGK